MYRTVWKANDYQIIKRIYKGTYTKVYIAICRKSGISVVLKVFTPYTQWHYTYIQREIEIHIELDHPNIVKLYAAFQDHRHVILVQEYQCCINIYDFLCQKKQMRMNSKMVHTLISQILDAVDYLHRRNICHRDIKKENIVILLDGTVKLLDFGVSIDLNDDVAVTRCGTDDYMAPEVRKCPMKVNILDNKQRFDLHYTLKADIWSIGILVYELIVGITPYIHHDTTDNTNNNNTNEISPQFPKTTDPQIEDFITACLNRTPILRPSIMQLRATPWIQSKP